MPGRDPNRWRNENDRRSEKTDDEGSRDFSGGYGDDSGNRNYGNNDENRAPNDWQRQLGFESRDNSGRQWSPGQDQNRLRQERGRDQRGSQLGGGSSGYGGYGGGGGQGNEDWRPRSYGSGTPGSFSGNQGYGGQHGARNRDFGTDRFANRQDGNQESWRSGGTFTDTDDRSARGEHDDRGLFERAGDWIQSKLGKAPKGYTRSDDRIRDELSESIWRRHDVDASEVEINVKDGEVTLTGTVNDRRTKRLLEDLAEDMLGVSDVHNQVKVRREGQTSYGAQTSSRTLGSASSSASISSPPTSTSSTTSKVPRA